MLTRSQVARRLGKSVATVRRIEGVLLHPVPDAKGIHRFDVDEVNTLAEAIVQGSVSLWSELHSDDEGGGDRVTLLERRCATAEAKAARLQRENMVWRGLINRLCSSPELRESVLAAARAVGA